MNFQASTGQDNTQQPVAPYVPTPSDIINSMKPPQQSSSSSPIRAIEIAMVVAIIVIGAAYLLFITGHLNLGKSTTSLLLTTTIRSINTTTKTYSFSGCSTLSNPGTYKLSGQAKYSSKTGSCILVTSSNVNILCAGGQIVGSGPFDALPPFTNGVYIANVENVSVSDCIIRNFSYGIATSSSLKVNVANSNLTSNYMSNIYFMNTSSSTVYNNIISKALSVQGSIYLANGSINDTIKNNTILFNQFYAINVSSNGNSYLYNKLNSTPQQSFYCSVPDSFPIGSYARGNSCFDNYGCGFAVCNGNNTPANISKISLGAQINSCGSITTPGRYALSGSIDMGDYVNISNPITSAKNMPCINIISSNVLLDCNGYALYNSTSAIAAYNVSNITVSDCRISNAKQSGISLISSPDSSVSKIIVVNSKVGVLINNSYADNVSNLHAFNDSFGVLMSNSKSNNLQSSNLSRDSYGIYLYQGSLGNNFYNITSFNSTSGLDVFAQQSVANAQDGFMSNSNCGKTNADWATCKQHSSPNLEYIPINGCSTLTTPGNYSLTQPVIGSQPNCMTIKGSNIKLSCNNHEIEAKIGGGYGALAENGSNVTINGCIFNNFNTGISAYNISVGKISNTKMSNINQGINLTSSSNIFVVNDTVNQSKQYGIYVYKTNHSSIMYNIVDNGFGQTIGIELNGSRNNSVLNNYMSQTGYGMVFTGSSENNTVTNNTSSLSTSYDFACYGNSALGDENGGINFGTTKLGCHWLAAVQSAHPQPQCTTYNQPGSQKMTSDYMYSFGSTCFGMYANYSTINCDGHTIIATNGGTLAAFSNSQGSTFENCYLKGFTAPVTASHSSVAIANSTFIGSWNGEYSYFGTGINVSYGSYSSLKNDNITGFYNGAYLYNTTSAALYDNLVSDAHYGYVLYNDTGVTINGNSAGKNVIYGAVINRSIDGLFQNNNLQTSSTGLQCRSTSSQSDNFSDFGNNDCNGEIGCSWISKSSSSC